MIYKIRSQLTKCHVRFRRQPSAGSPSTNIMMYLKRRNSQSGIGALWSIQTSRRNGLVFLPNHDASRVTHDEVYSHKSEVVIIRYHHQSVYWFMSRLQNWIIFIVMSCCAKCSLWQTLFSQPHPNSLSSQPRSEPTDRRHSTPKS